MHIRELQHLSFMSFEQDEGEIEAPDLSRHVEIKGQATLSTPQAEPKPPPTIPTQQHAQQQSGKCGFHDQFNQWFIVQKFACMLMPGPK